MAFGAYSRYYDLLYRDKDYEGETDYLVGLIRKYRPDARTVLDVGCGTGRHDECLVSRGYTVHGVDRSETMLAAAAERARPGLTFERGDITKLEIGRRFDVIISLFHVVSYLPDNAALERAFAAMSAHLNAGGLLVFDCWYGPAVLTDRPAVRVRRLEDSSTRVTRIAEPRLRPNDNLVDVTYEVLVEDRSDRRTDVISEVHTMRYLFLPEVRALLESNNLTLVRAEEWLTGREPGFDSWYVCFVGAAP